MNNFSDFQIAELAKLVESSVVAALISREYASIDDDDELTFDNIIIESSLAKKLKIDINNQYNDEQFLNDLREVFPENFRCSTAILYKKLEYFNRKITNKYSKDEILYATKKWILESEKPYHGKLHNFIYKHDKGVIYSNLLNILERIDSENNYESAASIIYYGK